METKIYAKGQWIHALLTSTQNPKILIPVKGKIYDVKYDALNPLYKIKIHSFYDTVHFLKMYMFGNHFQTDFNGATTRFKLTPGAYSSVDDVLDHAINGENWQKYLVVVDGMFCTKTLAEQKELYANLQDFLIQEKIKEIFELGNRSFYKEGRYYWPTFNDFEARLKKFVGDRIPKTKNWVADLLYRPDSDELDKAEKP